MLTLIRALVDYELDLIQIIAAQWDVDLAATDHIVAADELAASIINQRAVEDTWGRLSDEEKQALTDLTVQGGRLPYVQFMRRYGDIRPMGPARREREKPWLAPESVTEALYYRGLVVRAFEQSPSGIQEYIVVPSDLRELMPQPEARHTRPAPGYAVAPPSKLVHDHLMAPDDAGSLLAYLLIRQATNAQDWLSRESIEVIDRHLRRNDEPAYRALVTQLLYDQEFIADEQMLTQTSTLVDKERSRPWLEAPRTHQIRLLIETWLKSSTWNDMAYTPGLEADHWPNDPFLARQAILSALKEVPAEIWWSIEGFIEHIKQSNPDFQRPAGDYTGWYLRDAYSGEILHGFECWNAVEGTLIRFILEGPLRWLGVLRIRYGAFILTPYGLALLGRSDWPMQPDPQAHIRVDEQGVIGVPVNVSRYERLQIARFSAWIGTPPPNIQVSGKRNLPGVMEDEGTYLYRLTPQAIERITSEGITLQRHIIPFLQRLSGHSLPANVVQMLEAWEQSPAEVIVQDVVILTAKDLGVYERLRKHGKINRWLGQPVGPQAHAVRREDFPALLNALRQTGILPLFEGHEKDDWP
ncbi:MAG: hypothetical protein JXB07_13080 [Anaerolineae bacterium]|nr:hypothetical protein [Anaerolineae bacterium]